MPWVGVKIGVEIGVDLTMEIAVEITMASAMGLHGVPLLAAAFRGSPSWECPWKPVECPR